MDETSLEARAQPDIGRGFLAAVGAPAAAVSLGTLLLSVEAGFYAIPIALFAFIWAVIFAVFYVLLLGLPLYLLVSRFTAPGWWLCGACGAALGAAPVLLLADWSGDGLEPVLLFALMGLIGGLAFRWKLYVGVED